MSDLNSIVQLLNKGTDLGFQMESDLTEYSTNFENPDLMSSEFFDSILPLEKTNMDNEIFDMEVEMALTSDGSLGYDDIQCGLSTYSDSGLSSDPHELNTDQILSDEELFSVCSMLEHTVPGNAVNGAEKTTVKVEPDTSFCAETEFLTNETFCLPVKKTVEAKIEPVPIKKESVILQHDKASVAVVNPIKQTQSQPKYINIVKPNQKTKQVIKIQTVTGNQRSLLLPINIKDLKTIKIINTNNMKAEDVKITAPQNKIQSFETVQLKKIHSTEPMQVKKVHVSETMQAKRMHISETVQAKKINLSEKILIKSSSPEPDDDYTPSMMKNMNRRASTDGENEDDQYPPLMLTPEEKRLLCKDGIQLPLRYPLSKTQERELKRIRRKIRNKISAQDSRKRKKEYVDGLEERVKQCSEENRSLLKKIKLLQTQNNKLSTQLSKLQALIFKSGTSRAHPATCLMIVVLSVMLVSLPNLRNLSSDKELNSLQQFVARRALLFDQQATNEDLNMDELITFPSKEKKDDTNYSEVVNALEEPEVNDILNGSKKSFGELFVSIGETIMSKLKSSSSLLKQVNEHVPFKEKGGVTSGDPPEFDGKATRKRTIEFEIDDSWPPEKKNATAAKVMRRLL